MRSVLLALCLCHNDSVFSTRAVRLIEIVIKSRFERARFLNRFIARFFPRPRPPAVCYPIQSECSAPKWSARTEQTGHKDVTPGSYILRLWCVCGVYFSAPMLTDQSVHTAHGCSPAERSRSSASATVMQRSFPHGVYSCFAARAELKWVTTHCSR